MPRAGKSELGPMATPTSNLPNAPNPSSTKLKGDDRAAPELVDETQDDGDADGLPDHYRLA
jgi:hypothetical protein